MPWQRRGRPFVTAAAPRQLCKIGIDCVQNVT
jgi:hypothetical protein